MDYDLIVIGAGISGLTAAEVVSEKGAAVLVIDRKKKVGSGVSSILWSMDTVERFLEKVPNRSKWLLNTFKEIHFIPTSGKRININNNIGMSLLDRERLATEMAKKAVNNGAEMILGENAVLTPEKDVLVDGRRFSSKIIIAADGIASGTMRSAGVSTTLRDVDVNSLVQYCVAGVEADPSIAELHFGNKIAPAGYAWFYPMDKGIANVGVVARGDSPLKPLQALEHFINTRCPSAQPIYNHAGCYSAHHPLQPLVKDNIMVVGEAARLTHPLFCNGLYYSISSGHLAGRIAADVAMNKKDLSKLNGYQDSIRKAFSKPMKKGYELRDRFSDSSDLEIDRLLKKKIPAFQMQHSPKGFNKRWWGALRA